ncbi:MAG: hypothetical protein KC708_12535 [Anaerolineae bacterium]|nr:hypothetical protein [Anaerolineae bacterium]
MELRLIWRMLRRRWWLIVVPVVVAIVLTIPQFLNRASAVSGGFGASFKYSAAQETSNLPNRDGDFQDVWLSSEYVVNAFTDWVKSSTFRAELATATLGKDIDLSLLDIQADNDRSIGQVFLSYPDSDQLEAIAAAAITILRTRNQVYFPHLGGEPAMVTILDAPLVVPQQPSLPNRFGPLIQWGVALLGGLLLAVLAEYLDPMLHDQDDLKALGLRVLSSVPRR